MTSKINKIKLEPRHIGKLKPSKHRPVTKDLAFVFDDFISELVCEEELSAKPPKTFYLGRLYDLHEDDEDVWTTLGKGYIRFCETKPKNTYKVDFRHDYRSVNNAPIRPTEDVLSHVYGAVPNLMAKLDIKSPKQEIIISSIRGPGGA